MGTCCSACSGLSSAGRGGLHAASSEVPALPGEVLALLITSIHLRRGFGTVRTGTRPPPTADGLGSGRALTIRPVGLRSTVFPRVTPNKEGMGLSMGQLKAWKQCSVLPF